MPFSLIIITNYYTILNDVSLRRRLDNVNLARCFIIRAPKIN